MAQEKERSGFGERLKAIRRRDGRTQAEVAAATGLHPITLAHLERGAREPVWETVQALARALGVSTEEFRTDGGCAAEVKPLAAELPRKGRKRGAAPK